MTVHATPLHDRVLVRRLEEEEIAKGIIPVTVKEKPQEGEVMAVRAGTIEEGRGIRSPSM